jgi:hypothetical protein
MHAGCSFCSRYDCPLPVKCLDCGWEGKVSGCKHGYANAIHAGVEPCDYCPKCDSEDLQPSVIQDGK